MKQEGTAAQAEDGESQFASIPEDDKPITPWLSEASEAKEDAGKAVEESETSEDQDYPFGRKVKRDGFLFLHSYIFFWRL